LQSKPSVKTLAIFRRGNTLRVYIILLPASDCAINFSSRCLQRLFGFSNGKRITSRMDSAPVSSIVRRSIPIRNLRPAACVFQGQQELFIDLLRLFADLFQ